jgi:hypothetical protein
VGEAVCATAADDNDVGEYVKPGEAVLAQALRTNAAIPKATALRRSSASRSTETPQS